MKALRAPQQNTLGRAMHYGRQGNRLFKWSKALMLKLPVGDSKTSVSDTASALQALVSFQYQNKTCRIIGVLKFTTCKPKRSTSLHQGDRVQQKLGNKKTRGTRNIVKITYTMVFHTRAVRRLTASEGSRTELPTGGPAAWTKALVVHSSRGCGAVQLKISEVAGRLRKLVPHRRASNVILEFHVLNADTVTRPCSRAESEGKLFDHQDHRTMTPQK